MGDPRAPYMARTDKERLATGFWNRIESNQATDYNTPLSLSKANAPHGGDTECSLVITLRLA